MTVVVSRFIASGSVLKFIEDISPAGCGVNCAETVVTARTSKHDIKNLRRMMANKRSDSTPLRNNHGVPGLQFDFLLRFTAFNDLLIVEGEPDTIPGLRDT